MYAFYVYIICVHFALSPILHLSARYMFLCLSIHTQMNKYTLMIYTCIHLQRFAHLTLVLWWLWWWCFVLLLLLLYFLRSRTMSLCWQSDVITQHVFSFTLGIFIYVCIHLCELLTMGKYMLINNLRKWSVLIMGINFLMFIHCSH